MNKKTTKFLIPLIFIILGGALVGYSIFYILSSQMVGVISPKEAIKIGTKLTKENTQINFISSKDVHAKAIKEANWTELLGKTANTDLEAGEVLLWNRVVENQGKTVISKMVDKLNSFAVQVPLEDGVSPVGISTDDYVVLTTTSQGTDIVTGKIGKAFRVITVATSAEGVSKGLTLEVTPDMLVTVQHALQTSKIRVALISKEHFDNKAQAPIHGISNPDFINFLKTAK